MDEAQGVYSAQPAEKFAHDDPDYSCLPLLTASTIAFFAQYDALQAVWEVSYSALWETIPLHEPSLLEHSKESLVSGA